MSPRFFKMSILLILSLVVVSCSFLPSANQENLMEVVLTTETAVDTDILENDSVSISENPENPSTEKTSEIEVEEMPFVLETSGPSNFSGQLTNPDVVLLTWDPVPGVSGYAISISKNNIDWYPLVELPSEINQYEDLMAPENTLLSYRLATLEGEESGVSSLQIQTKPRDPNPRSVQAVVGDEMVTTALIGSKGGVLSATDTKGVNYLLEIPENALLLETEVSMTPLVDITNWPLDGNLHAGVHLEPDGWLLYEPAMLTITLPNTPSSDLAQVGFGFNGMGEEFHLTTVYPDLNSLGKQTDNTFFVGNSYQQTGRVIRLPVMELKGNGVGETSAQTAGDLVKNNPPTDLSNVNDQKAAAASAVDDLELAPLLSPQELAAVVPYNMYKQIFAIKDCYDFKRTVAAFQAWESGVSNLTKSNWSRDLMENFGKKAVEVAKAAANECANSKEGVVPSSVPCAEKMIRDIQSGSSPFFQELQNSMKSTPGALGELLKAQKDLDKCPHSFKVNEASTLGMQWISGCIPSLDRPFQVIFKNPSGTNLYRLYPDGPFSGRVEGDGKMDMEGANMSYVYSGTYKVEVLGRDNNDKINELDILTSMKRTTIICTEGDCISFDDEVESAERIPIMVSPTRCVVP